MHHQLYKITGMSCVNCAGRIEKKLSSLAGVRTAVVNFPMEQLKVEYDPALIQAERIEAEIVALGYGAGRADGAGELRFGVRGMHELVRGDILCSDGAGLRPIASKRVSQRQILPNAGVGIRLASGSLEHLDCVARVADKGEGQSIVGRADGVPGGIKKFRSLDGLALRDLDEDELQNNLRLIRIDAERILVGSLG